MMGRGAHPPPMKPGRAWAETTPILCVIRMGLDRLFRYSNIDDLNNQNGILWAWRMDYSILVPGVVFDGPGAGQIRAGGS